jgi:hypothetical protein
MAHPIPACLRVVALLAGLPLLASCGPGVGKFPPACPVAGLVKPLEELDRFRGGSQDIRDLIVRARISNIVGVCKAGENATAVDVSVKVVIDATRGPALEGSSYNLPIFVALTDANGIRDKALFNVPVAFAGNVDTARVASNEYEMSLAVTPKISGAAYGIVAGFQLTPEELAIYRRNTHP